MFCVTDCNDNEKWLQSFSSPASQARVIATPHYPRTGSTTSCLGVLVDVELINNTALVAGFTLGMMPDGRESVVVVVKGSYSIPSNSSATPVLLEEQLALQEADTFHGDPGFSSPLLEADFALIKQRCDITLIGTAHAPGDKPAQRVQTGFKVGTTSKLVDVLGDRHWIADANGISISQPASFLLRPFTYDIAFGGTDRAHEDTRLHDAYLPNPSGIGYHKALDQHLVDGTPAPSTEEPGKPVKHPHELLRPMSFGPVGRGWQPRVGYGGTYDDDWLDQRFPFLPDDFDLRYFQSSPADQQCHYLQGGEQVRLVNLTPSGRCQFQIPQLHVPVCFFKKKSQRVEKKAVIDTLVIEPDEGRFTLTWRTQIPLQRNLFEIPEILVGTASRNGGRARDSDKPLQSTTVRADNTDAGSSNE